MKASSETLGIFPIQDLAACGRKTLNAAGPHASTYWLAFFACWILPFFLSLPSLWPNGRYSLILKDLQTNARHNGRSCVTSTLPKQLQT